MKKSIIILLGILILSFSVKAQHGFIIEYLAGGPFYEIDLTTAGLTPIGQTQDNFGAGDFGMDEMLYAINSETNQLFQIDTTNGTTTLIGSLIPPIDHTWTGMAYDEATETMYAYSAYAVATGEGSLHIVDVTNSTYTLVGTQTTAPAISCIAIDGTGQMYGMYLSGNASIYRIDKTNGALSIVGSIGQGAAGMGHGMDYCNADQTMYLTTYNSVTFENTLRIVNLTNGSTTQVGGSLGGWMGVLAIPGTNSITAAFSADKTDVCAVGVVHFTDETIGATSWSWTFEGGVPPSSTLQNPSVVYNDAGVFDVTLSVSNGISTDVLTINDMINVDVVPDQPTKPEGLIEVCSNTATDYQTTTGSGADNLFWNLIPSEAGSISGTGENISIFWTDDYIGNAYLSVYASNDCGAGATSDTLEIIVEECTGIDVHKNFEMKIYPNPVNEKITVSFNLNETLGYELSVYNQLGQQVYKSDIDQTGVKDSHQINVSTFPQGIYIVRLITTSNEVYQSKFEIVR